MPIKQRYQGFQVTVNRKSALDGYKRIRVQVNGSYEDAKDKEKEIKRALDKFGKWPVSKTDKPLDKPMQVSVPGSGSLRKAYRIALDTHWRGMAWGEKVAEKEDMICGWFEKEDCRDLDDITSAKLNDFVKHRQDKGIAPSTIRQDVGVIKKVHEIATKRVPPLTKRQLPDPPTIKIVRAKKWFLKPELVEDTMRFIEQDMGVWQFADFCRSMVFQGLRVEENSRVQVNDFIGLDTDTPNLLVRGTKNETSDRTVPVYKNMVSVYRRNVIAARSDGRVVLWPWSKDQLRNLWGEVRAHLGEENNKHATLRALRRSFAWYAKVKGIRLEDIQDLMGHSNITTTRGYLRLVGDPAMEMSREKMDQPLAEHAPQADSSWIADAMRAYKEVENPSAAEMALFVKTLKE